MNKNLTDGAVRESREALKVLREGGLDHEDRLFLFDSITSGSEIAVKIWLHALDTARERLRPKAPGAERQEL